MGQEAKCEVSFEGKTGTGKALLETDDLIFRGEFKFSIPLKSIQSVDATDGVLRVKAPAGTALLSLGGQAERWAHRIRNPRTLADKLDVKPDLRVSLINVPNILAGRTMDVSEGKAAKDSDLIFFGAETEKDLSKLPKLSSAMKRNGGIWVVYPKGKKEITEMTVLNAGRAAGLVDTKIARFSDTHTAHKFVIPVANR